jgi:thiamine pyrophosphokinase|tara:strand:+ start:131 stop:760 length:630 start_codon:yes stop_codon:yes gene_type:complete
VEVGVTLLIAAGDIGDDTTLATSCQVATRVIAVDGGVRHLRHLNIAPDVIVGDLDSASESDLEWGQENGSEIIHLKEQETSDLAKALNLCNERQWSHIQITGIEGGRMDHQLGSLASISDASFDLNIKAELSNTTLTRITTNQHFQQEFSGTFSLFSFGQSVVTLTGADWNLENDIVTFSTKGLSNQSDGPISIKIHSGDSLILLCNKE